MMMAMVVIYAFCWLPLHCITVLGDLVPAIWNFDGIQLVWIVCHWLAVSSCCWNPIVYYWTNDTLRTGFTYALGMWCRWMRLRRPTSPPEAAAAAACRRQVVYRCSLRGSDVQVEKDVRRTAPFVQRPSAPIRYRARRTNARRSNNIELRELRASTSAGCSSRSSAVGPAVIRSC